MSNGVAAREVERQWGSQWVGDLPVEVRSSEAGKASRTVGGYASVFNKRSQPLCGFVEIVEPSCFRKTIADGLSGVVCRFNHDDALLLGTTYAKTLRISQDRTGLLYEVDLPESRADVLELVARKDIHNSSFAFQVYDEEWSHDEGMPVRHLTSARLIDVAPVTTPAYPDATVGLRSLAIQFDAPFTEVEQLAQRNELRQLFTRTDQPSMSGRQALLELMRIHPSAPPVLLGRSPAQAKLELTKMMEPQPIKRRSGAEAKAELTELMRLPYETAASVGLDTYGGYA